MAMITGQTLKADSTIDVSGALATLNREGIVGCKQAFERAWVAELAEDVETAFSEARVRPNGAVGRGPHRWYVEVHPEALRGFIHLVDHPWVRGLSEAALGKDYRIVEIGFDIPFAGAVNQPWHRDFPSPPETYDQGRLTSLAFNVTCVDTEADMGPFEIAPGTQWESGSDFDHQMFPSRSEYSRYESLAVRKYPQMGDISARSALTIHRGTKNYSDKARPVLVLGVDAPGAGNAAHHDLAVTRAYWNTLPKRVKKHLSCPIVAELRPIEQKHSIEGLVMGEAE